MAPEHHAAIDRCLQSADADADIDYLADDRDVLVGEEPGGGTADRDDRRRCIERERRADRRRHIAGVVDGLQLHAVGAIRQGGGEAEVPCPSKVA